MMTLHEIYETFTPGSEGFAEAVLTYCGFGISSTEAQRLGRLCATPEEFQTVWENEVYWTDNSAEESGEPK